MTPIAKEQWARKAASDPYWRGRWRYLQVAREFLLGVPGADPDSKVLELGAGGLPLCSDSDRIAKYAQGVAGTIVHNLLNFPWPLPADARYAVVIALEVLEHLDPGQPKVVAQIRELADWFLFSVPYMWPAGDRMHLGRNLKDLQRWTGNLPWQRWHVVTTGGPPVLIVLADLRDRMEVRP